MLLKEQYKIDDRVCGSPYPNRGSASGNNCRRKRQREKRR